MLDEFVNPPASANLATISPNQRVITAVDYAPTRYLFRVPNADWLTVDPLERIRPGDVLLIESDVKHLVANASSVDRQLCVLRLPGIPPRFEIRRSSLLDCTDASSPAAKSPQPPVHEEARNSRPEGQRLRTIRLPDRPQTDGTSPENDDSTNTDVNAESEVLGPTTPSKIIGVVLRLFRDY